MLVEIIQKIGIEDKSPEKIALLNEENIRVALNSLYPDEDFEIKVVSRPVDVSLESSGNIDFTEREKGIVALCLCGFIIRNPYQIKIAESVLSIAQKLKLYDAVIADIESFNKHNQANRLQQGL